MAEAGPSDRFGRQRAARGLHHIAAPDHAAHRLDGALRYAYPPRRIAGSAIRTGNSCGWSATVRPRRSPPCRRRTAAPSPRVPARTVLGKARRASGPRRAARPSLPAEPITRALQALRALGRVRCIAVPTAGRPAETWEAAVSWLARLDAALARRARERSEESGAPHLAEYPPTRPAVDGVPGPGEGVTSSAATAGRAGSAQGWLPSQLSLLSQCGGTSAPPAAGAPRAPAGIEAGPDTSEQRAERSYGRNWVMAM